MPIISTTRIGRQKPQGETDGAFIRYGWGVIAMTVMSF